MRQLHAVRQKKAMRLPADLHSFSRSFHHTVSFCAHHFLGLHLEGDRAVFRVYAEHATAVYAVGDFNQWCMDTPLTRLTPQGLWEGSTDAKRLTVHSLYKFRIESENDVSYRADPYARCVPVPPETASAVPDPTPFAWEDDAWLSYRHRVYTKAHGADLPLLIYEMHLGSHSKNQDGTPYTYTQYAKTLPSYLKQMGYTHVEFLPIAAHPYVPSWGYQSLGHYAPDARLGTEAEFCALINALHLAGIGVILDWTPAHFPKDAHGLCEFDGAPLYEKEDPQQQEHPVWGTCLFDFSRPEVRSYLSSCALHWIEDYHIDGLRFDAVAAILCPDYDRPSQPGAPKPPPDPHGIAFLQGLNAHLQKHYGDILTFAEDSSSFDGVTKSVSAGGLGFSYRWDLGAQRDLLFYAQLPSAYRKEHHGRLTYPLRYAFSERYCLPLSHDEVVHGKRSFLSRMGGEYAQQFACARALLGYYMTRPGKKLFFMGYEIGQFTEWNYDDSIEWFLLDYPAHAALQTYVRALNHLYLATPALYTEHAQGFSFLQAENDTQSVYTYLRTDDDGNLFLCVLNASDQAYPNYRVGVPQEGLYTECFSSEERRFFGSGQTNGARYTEKEARQGRAHTLTLDLPPLSFTLFSHSKPRKNSSDRA